MTGARAQLASREIGAGDPLVLINGYAATKDDWDPAFVGALAEVSTVICPDNRGVGESPAIDAPLTVTAMAEDVLAAMDAHGVDEADVIGWSMGGFIAQEIAAQAPARVRRLVLLSTDGGGPRSVTCSADIWGRLTDHGGTPREQATRLLALLFPDEVATAVDAEFGDLVAAARMALTPEALSAQEEAMSRWHTEPAEDRLRAIAAPALIAAGAEDVVIPVANSRRLGEALAGSRLVVFDGCGHAFMAQEPRRLGDEINAWLGR